MMYATTEHAHSNWGTQGATNRREHGSMAEALSYASTVEPEVATRVEVSDQQGRVFLTLKPTENFRHKVIHMDMALLLGVGVEDLGSYGFTI